MSDNAYINDLETRLGEANARITALEAELAEAKENADVSRKVADAFGETLCKIAGTTDRIAACVIASDKFAAALATVEKCKQAGFIDERGEVRKVLGTLPTTADNHIVGSNCTIWHPKHGASVCRSDVDSGCWAQTSDPYAPASGDLYLVEECYSTKAAAAKGGAAQ